MADIIQEVNLLGFTSCFFSWLVRLDDAREKYSFLEKAHLSIAVMLDECGFDSYKVHRSITSYPSWRVYCYPALPQITGV